MGTNVCMIALLLMAFVAVVTCTNGRQRRACDAKCQYKLFSRPAGKRTKSVDLNQDSYPWNQGDTSPTYTADAKPEDQKSTCIFDEALKKISPKWQGRLLSVLEAALMESKGKAVDDSSFGL